MQKTEQFKQLQKTQKIKLLKEQEQKEYPSIQLQKIKKYERSSKSY